jgi:hypothetical protein
MTTRAERAGRSHRKKLRDLDVRLAQTRSLPARLSASDRALIKRARLAPLDVEKLEEEGIVSAYTMLWMVTYGLLSTWIDPHERVWLRATKLGTVMEDLHPEEATALKQEQP